MGARKFTHEEDKKILEEYLLKPVKRLANEMGRSGTGIKGALNRMGLVIPEELIQQRKDASRIKKGNISFNKGKRQEEYMSVEAIERTKITRFKKGNLPHNTKDENGVTSIRYDKTGIPYQYIRIDIGRWVLHHRHLWKEAFGEIPPKHCITFKDENTLNVTIGNLKLISMNENARRNHAGFLSLPPELKETKTLINKLNKKVHYYGKH